MEYFTIFNEFTEKWISLFKMSDKNIELFQNMLFF